MTAYRVNVGLTYFVDAEDEDGAEDEAYTLAHAELGSVVSGMYFDVEEMD